MFLTSNTFMYLKSQVLLEQHDLENKGIEKKRKKERVLLL